MPPTKSKLNVSDSALPYILYQRTEYLRSNPLFLFLTYVGVVPFLYKITVWLKTKLFASRIKQAFCADMQAEYDRLRDHLPSHADSILDIGCGVAGIDVFLGRHYRFNPRIYLLDKTATDPVVYYGFESKGSVYNSLDVSRDMLIANGVAPGQIHTQEATDQNEILFPESFDIVISLISWGFHYPVLTYIETVHQKMKPGGVLIIDIRTGTGGEQDISRFFGTYETIYQSGKVTRILARKS